MILNDEIALLQLTQDILKIFARILAMLRNSRKSDCTEVKLCMLVFEYRYCALELTRIEKTNKSYAV